MVKWKCSITLDQLTAIFTVPGKLLKVFLEDEDRVSVIHLIQDILLARIRQQPSDHMLGLVGSQYDCWYREVYHEGGKRAGRVHNVTIIIQRIRKCTCQQFQYLILHVVSHTQKSITNH